MAASRPGQRPDTDRADSDQVTLIRHTDIAEPYGPDPIVFGPRQPQYPDWRPAQK